MADHDAVEIKLADHSEVIVTDEQVRAPYVAGIGIDDHRHSELSWAYAEFTLDELVQLRDELTRRIETRGPVVAEILAEEEARPVHFHGLRPCRMRHLHG